MYETLINLAGTVNSYEIKHKGIELAKSSIKRTIINLSGCLFKYNTIKGAMMMIQKIYNIINTLHSQ